jgi:hypothetical protein
MNCGLLSGQGGLQSRRSIDDFTKKHRWRSNNHSKTRKHNKVRPQLGRITMTDDGNETDNQPKNSSGNGIGVGVAMGVAVGAAYGAASGNMAQSLAMGVALGTAFGAIFDF